MSTLKKQLKQKSKNELIAIVEQSIAALTQAMDKLEELQKVNKEEIIPVDNTQQVE